MPELPTIAEQGLPGFEVNSWTGLVAPPKTPPAIVKRLYSEVVKIVESQDMKDFLASTGAEPALMGPEEFRAYIKADDRPLRAGSEGGGDQARLRREVMEYW